MARLMIELPWNYSEKEYDDFLKENELVHLKSHGDKYFKVGDALRSKKGCIARIVDKFNNYENLSHDYTIANNKLSVEEMRNHFLSSSIIYYERINDGKEILFTVSLKVLNNRTVYDIMNSFGFPPAGYGIPYDEETKDGILTFKCSNSCD